MKADALFIITMVVFIFVAWVATGGPSRPIASAGPWITPITRSGEESQGYRTTPPSNPLNAAAYPRRIGRTQTISSGSGGTSGAPSGTGAALFIRGSAGVLAENPNQEYLSFRNSANATTTTTGWTITVKSSGATVTLPRLLLPPKAQETVVTGRSGQATICENHVYCVFLNRSLELYASSKETITLKDASGKVVDTYSY